MAGEFIFSRLHVIHVDRKPSQSLIIDVDSPRVHGCNHHIDPQIELETVNQKRIGDVLRDDAALVNGHLRDFADLLDYVSYLQ